MFLKKILKRPLYKGLSRKNWRIFMIIPKFKRKIKSK